MGKIDKFFLKSDKGLYTFVYCLKKRKDSGITRTVNCRKTEDRYRKTFTISAAFFFSSKFGFAISSDRMRRCFFGNRVAIKRRTPGSLGGDEYKTFDLFSVKLCRLKQTTGRKLVMPVKFFFCFCRCYSGNMNDPFDTMQ